MFLKTIVTLIALGIPLMVQGYSAGAPKEECEEMTPRHQVAAQKGSAPYEINISKKNIRAGETIQITIRGRSDDDVIKGILVQARVGNTPIGSFDASPSSQYIQLLDCGNSRGSAITHKKIVQPVREVKFNWTAPKDLTERVNIVATIAKNGGVFWVAQRSDTLNVK